MLKRQTTLSGPVHLYEASCRSWWNWLPGTIAERQNSDPRQQISSSNSSGQLLPQKQRNNLHIMWYLLVNKYWLCYLCRNCGLKKDVSLVLLRHFLFCYFCATGKNNSKRDSSHTNKITYTKEGLARVHLCHSEIFHHSSFLYGYSRKFTTDFLFCKAQM